MSKEPGNSNCMVQMPQYQGHQKVWALKIDHCEVGLDQDTGNPVSCVLIPENKVYAPINVGVEYYEKHKPGAGGYYVVYPGGYITFYPAEVFDGGFSSVDYRTSLQPDDGKGIDYTEIRDDKIRGEICTMMSDMLDNPDRYGIYPTSKFMWEMENFCLALRNGSPVIELLSKILDILEVVDRTEFCTENGSKMIGRWKQEYESISKSLPW